MPFWDDERGQAIQIGAVLLFAVLVIAFSLYQAFVVPNQNEQIELDHNVEVQQQLQDLRNAIVSMPGRTSGTGTTISLGTSYPARVVALNPPPPSGRLTTIGTTDQQVNLTITNATAVGETGDLWNGSTRPYNTGGIAYEPNYNEYRDPPTTIYENTLLYNTFRGGNLTLAGQSLISGDRISLVTLNGSLSRSSSASTTVDTQPISSSDRTILVTGNATSPITLNLTTRLSASRWTTLLDDEANVDTVAPAPNAAVPDPFTRVQITLDPGQYRLQMAKVGVGTGTSEESASYLTDISGNGTTITRGDSQDITLEVRDAYNNPLSGVLVNGTVPGSNAGQLDQDNETTDTDGQVTFQYNTTAATSTDTHEIRFSLRDIDSGYGRTGVQNVSAYVTVEEPPQTGSGGGSGPFNVSWADPSAMSANSGDDISGSDGEYTWDVGASDDNSLQLNATTSPAYEGVDMDFAVNNSTVGTVSPGSDQTDSRGVAVTDLTVTTNGTLNLSAAGGAAGDTITIEVTNITASTLGALVEDYSNENQDQGNYLVSYELLDPPGDFQKVGVHFIDTNNAGNTTWLNSTSEAGTLTLEDGNAALADFDIEVTAYRTDGTSIDTWSVSDTADGVNPGNNVDLGDGTSPTFSSYTIEDKSSNGNGHRYRIDYTATASGFDRVGGYLVAQNPNSGQDSRTSTQTSQTNWELSTYGFDNNSPRQMKTTLLLFDNRGVVVDRVVWIDGSDGSGTTSG